jgi:hypothetical protein
MCRLHLCVCLCLRSCVCAMSWCGGAVGGDVGNGMEDGGGVLDTWGVEITLVSVVLAWKTGETLEN